jgi:hypothetical protein
LKEFLVLGDDETLFRGSTECETANEFMHRYELLYSLYDEFDRYVKDRDFDRILGMYHDVFYAEQCDLSAKDFRVIHVGFLILEALYKDGSLLALVEEEFYGLESMSEFFVHSSEGIDVQDGYVLFGDERVEFKEVKWV